MDDFFKDLSMGFLLIFIKIKPNDYKSIKLQIKYLLKSNF